MPSNNVAILSIMSKFDEKSAREAAQRANKVYDEALSDIGNVNFDKKLLDNFDKAMNLLKNKFKKVNLSSYTNNLLDSIFSDKDISEKSKDIESFIKKIDLLKKASSGQDINAFNTFSSKQIEALISRTEKLAQKQDEINEKTREYNREATKIAKTNRSISTVDKNYGNQDYTKTLESLKKSLGTEKEFTAEQNQSIENLAKMVNLYQVMEKSEPQKGTAEAIRYSKDLLAVTQKIKEERDKIDAFSQNGASTYIANNGLSSIDKVSDYTVNKAKDDFTKANLSNLKAQETKLQSELTTYISDSVQKNLAKVSKEADAVIDKAEKRVENLQNKIDSLQSKPNNTVTDNSLIDNIVSDSDIKSLEEIEDRLYAISDLDADGEATKQQLKEYIQLYKQYEQLIANDSTVKFDPGLKEEYDFIIESDSKLKKYADTLDETIVKQKELNATKSDEKNTSTSVETEQLVKQEEQIKQTVQAEEKLIDTQNQLSSNTKISVDTEQAIADINKVKENLESIPDEKKIKISVNDNDYTNTPLLSDAEGNTITAFRGVVGAWSGLINQDGIGFFTDKLKLAADYADSLAESGKVYQANLSFKNPLEVEGNGAKWDEIDFNGVKKTTDEIVELAKQLGHDGVIFKNIRDGFTDTEEDISNVMVALNAAQIKNEQVIGTVKAGTGKMIDVANKIDNATDTATNSTVESQNKIQEELKETQKVAEQVSEAMSNVSSDKLSASSPIQTFDNSMQQDLVMLENYKNTIKEIDALKLEPETEETKAKIEELNKLADYFVSKISVIRSENGGYVSQSMMKFSEQWNETLKKYPDNARNELYKLASEKSGLQMGSVSTEFIGIEKEISNIESKSELLRLSLTQSMQDSIKYVKELKYAFTTLAASQDELKTEKNPKWIEGFNSDINKALSKFPELIQFKDKFTEDQALQFVKTDEWNKFLSTLPQAQEYLKSIGYSFEEISDKSNISSENIIGSQAKENTQALNDEINSVNSLISAFRQLYETNKKSYKGGESLLVGNFDGSTLSHMGADFSSIETDVIDGTIKAFKDTTNQVVSFLAHTHPGDVAAFSAGDIYNAFFDYINNQIKNYFIIAKKEISWFDTSSLDGIDHEEFLEKFKDNKERIVQDIQEETQVWGNFSKYLTNIFDGDLYGGLTKLVKDSIDNSIANLGEHKIPEDVLNSLYIGLEEKVRKYIDSINDNDFVSASAVMNTLRRDIGSGLEEYSMSKPAFANGGASKLDSTMWKNLYNELKSVFDTANQQNENIQNGIKQALIETLSSYGINADDVYKSMSFDDFSKAIVDGNLSATQSAREAIEVFKQEAQAVENISSETPIKDVFQGGTTSAEKLEEEIKNIDSATEKASESAKEYRKILSQVGEFDIDSKVSAMYKRNDGQLESWTWRAKKDDEGNILYDQNGKIDYDEPTITVISKYEQLEKNIVKADNELRNLQKDLSEIKAYDPTASTTNIEAKISDQKEYIRLLEQTVKIISQSDEYLLDEQQIIEARNKAAREYALTTGAKQEKTDAKQSASDEKKRLANIEQVNRALNKQQITIDAIEKTYNKTTNPDLDREVSNQQDLAKLAQKKLAIQTKINSLQGQERNSANEKEFLELEKLIAEYKELAKYKLKANNPSKQELGGQNLQTLIQVQISNYDKLITKAEKYGDTTSDTVEKLKEQRDILSKIGSDGKYSATADQYYASRDTYKVESAALSAFEAETKAAEQEAKAVKDVWDKNVKVIQDYMDAVTKLNNLNAKDKGTGKYASQIDLQEKNVEELKEKALEARTAITSMINPHDVPLDTWRDYLDVMEKFSQASLGSAESIAKLKDALTNMSKTKIESMESSLKSYQDKVFNLSIKSDDAHRFPEYQAQLDSINKAIEEYKTFIDSLQGKGIIDESDIKEANRLKSIIEGLLKNTKKFSSGDKSFTNIGSDKVLEKINSILEQNSRMSKTAKDQIKAYYNEIYSGNPTRPLNEILDSVYKIVQQEREAGRVGKSWLDVFKDKKIYSFIGQAASMFSFYDLINVGRKGFQTIRELNTALTEMKKVSDETTQSLKNYQSTTFDIGDDVGATAKTIQNSTADWLRLGESIDEAAESAKVSNILLNVSEFESIDEATESLVAMSQAYSELGKMDIIDVLNNIGNNYSIATDGLATALQKSASALKTANNDLNSAVALATAGNAVVQDPDSVGAGIRTISLRLVGTEAAKQELESIGEETDGVITTTSKLRDTILSATAAATNDGKGFDIFDSNGNYKSTYEIMQGLADLYDDIVAKDKELGTNNLNLLLETIAGKNRSNIAASILQNGEMLRSVYQDAQNSSGSAQKELDSYLDSIDGRMTQLENRAQEFWYKVIDSDTIKNGITLLTDLLELGVNIVDTFGVLPTVMAGVGAGLAIKNIGRPKMFGLYKYADINMCSLGY